MWTAVTTMMPHAHASHTATLLAGAGTVLLAGGRTSNCGTLSATNNVDLYDPTLGMGGGWGPSTNMQVARYDHVATTLKDGTVLVTGGRANAFTTLSNAEVYDPVANTWTLTAGAMTTPRELHQSIVLPDGSVLLTGGDDDSSAALASAEIYDPVAGTFTATAPMSTPRVSHVTAAIPGGLVIAVGGTDGTASLSSTEIYDPTAKTWSPGPSLTESRSLFTLEPLGQDLLAAGGFDTTVIATAEVLSFGAAPGTPCTMPSDCASGFCASGVCCNVACTGTCMACSAKLKGSGTDGTCGPSAAGTNPGNACVNTGAASCGTTGLCDGNGACATYPDGTGCGAVNECSDGACAKGTCAPVHKLDGTPCTGGICVAGGCLPDPHLSVIAVGSGGAASTSSGGAGGGLVSASSGGGGQGAAPVAAARLTGDGCSTRPVSGSPAWRLLVALVALGVLRRPRAPRRTRAAGCGAEPHRD
jgi:hypothetical protein